MRSAVTTSIMRLRFLSHFAWLPWLAAAVGTTLLLGTSCAGRAPGDDDGGEGEGEGEGEPASAGVPRG
jgi:hypothetical protein